MQNFLMDFVAVTGVNLFLKRRKKYFRLLVVATVSSVAGLLLVLSIRNDLLYSLIAHFLLNTVMVFLGFGKCGKKEFLENWLVTYLVVILLGGGMQWLWESSLLPQNYLLKAGVVTFGGYLTLLYFMQRKERANHIFEVLLRKDNRCIRLKGYWDSGNQLRDPYTGQGVSILSHAKAKEFLDAERDRIRYVPYRSLGEEAGMLGVTNMDEIVLMDGKKMVCFKQVAIGIAGQGLLEGKEYDLILHVSINP